ncbi:type VI secretion system protein TssA [Massilia sp. PWRC2]|uniref:type VI secretion system protein TssA n=1 Tax=Massilia sp. PWRC2 TaxID=2804626 RepID=UPI003CEB2ADF
MDIEELLAPVSEQAPCGDDLAFSTELDAIARARQADDPSLEQGAWVTALKEADWKFVASGCSGLLKTRSKDLRLAVWLAEAAAKTAGARALGDALLVTAGLCERYWDGVYPLADDEGHEQRIGNLAWIAARVAQLARELPVTEGLPAYSLNDFASASARSHAAAGNSANSQGGPVKSAPDLDGARRKSSTAFYARLLDECSYCEAAVNQLERVVDQRLGADGPGFSAARASLQDLAHFVRPLLAHQQKVAPSVPAPPTAVAAPPAGPDGTPSLAPLLPPMQSMPLLSSVPAHAALRTRADALEQLRAVAAFFRQTEPHSPVAYLADKAARWGEQPLHVWLRAVIKDDVLFGQLEDMLGAGKAG